MTSRYDQFQEFRTRLNERILGKQPVVHAVCVGVPGTPGHAPLPVQGYLRAGAR